MNTNNSIVGEKNYGCNDCCFNDDCIRCKNNNFIQLYDRSYTNVIRENDKFMNLSDEGINPDYRCGDYYLSKYKTKNDTLIIPKEGLYQIDFSFVTCFKFNEETVKTSRGDSFGLDFSLIETTGKVMERFLDTGVVPNQAEVPIIGKYSRNFMYKVPKNTGFRLKLNQFDFNAADMGSLYVFSIVFIVRKIEC